MEKRFLRKTALLLAVLTLLLAVLSACGNDPAGESSTEAGVSEAVSGGESAENDNSEADPDTSADTSADESKEPEESSSGEGGDEPLEEDYVPTVVSIGCSYVASAGVGENYPDTNKAELTDGMFAPTACSYMEDRLVGYTVGATDGCTIRVDLGKVTKRVHQFELSYLCTHEAGIGPVSSVKVSVSDDNKTWTEVGACVVPANIEGEMQVASLSLDNAVSCRYVQFAAAKTAYWLFFDEVTVIADVAGGSAGTPWGEAVSMAYKSDKKADADYASDLQKVASGTPDRTLNHFNVAKGASYTADGETISGFTDDRKKLTDGATGSAPNSEVFVGFKGGQTVTAVVTLGKEETDICGFGVHCFSARTLDTLFPLSAAVSVSSDGKTWTDVGRAYAPVPNAETATFALELPVTVKAKWVKFTLVLPDCKQTLIDELYVYAYRDQIESDSFYPFVHFPDVKENEFWKDSEKDYDKVQNLLLGLPQQIRCFNDAAVKDDGNNTSPSSGLMTDGKYTTDNGIHNGFFFKFNHGVGREVYYDLGKVSALQSFTIGFTHLPDWGVYAPDTVEVVLSDDGKTWYKVGEIKYNLTGVHTFRETLSLKTPVAARFICFSFPVSSWAGIDEIEVKGTKKVASNVKLIEKAGYKKFSFSGTPESGADWAGPSKDLLGGVKDIFLAYHNATHPRKENDLLAEVAYLDKDGNIKDTMFDGFLFLMSGQFPSGSGGGTGGVLKYNKSDMEWLLNSLFTEGQNILALEETVGKVKAALSLPDSYKVKYFVSLYYPESDNFGDIDGDGVNENLKQMSGKAKVLKWWISQFEAKRATYKFKNIEFCGYYWYNESLSSDQIPMTKEVADYIHSYRSQFFWIPYFSAGGVSEWRKYGLDMACLQPNYAFSLDVPDSRVVTAANMARNYGLCVEIEMAEASVNDPRYRRRYFEYLKQGAKMGYMTEATHMYYMGMYIHDFATSKAAGPRMIYDYTYQFIKGTLQITPDALPEVNVEAKAGKPLTGKLPVENASQLVLSLIESPKHGSVTVNADGTFAYYPNPGFTGTDSFLYAYSEGMDNSAPCIVNIEVK